MTNFKNKILGAEIYSLKESFFMHHNLMDVICRIKFENPGHFHSTDKSHYCKILKKVFIETQKLW